MTALESKALFKLFKTPKRGQKPRFWNPEAWEGSRDPKRGSGNKIQRNRLIKRHPLVLWGAPSSSSSSSVPPCGHRVGGFLRLETHNKTYKTTELCKVRRKKVNPAFLESAQWPQCRHAVLRLVLRHALAAKIPFLGLGLPKLVTTTGIDKKA